MTFSIVIPVRNGSTYLAESLRCALGQTRPADEVVVVDDHSEDDSASIAKSSEWGKRVEYYSNPIPTGFADAWNRAATKATGEFVSILHQDDLLDPEYLEAMECALDKFPRARHLYSGCRYMDGSGKVIRTSPLPHRGEPILYTGCEYASRYLKGVWNGKHIHRCPGVLTARSLLVKECAYRKEAGHIADDDFFYRVGALTDVVGISKPMASYREHAASATGQARLLPLQLAQDYLFQIRHRQDRAEVMAVAEEVILEKLAVRAMNEALYYVLVAGLPGHSEVLKSADELDAVAPRIFARYLPVWGRPIWSAVRSGRIRDACLWVLAVRACRGFKRRLRRKSRAERR
ncbi:MAG TPA: glycosyltransferase family 2 protein [Candidatus Acidoferrum sp.]|jgi:hypothetical protein|nr:glycosyltransferase family 2 protein [Candidatus Acidoferrum sp.]